MAFPVELVILGFLFCATVGVVNSDNGKPPLTHEMKNFNSIMSLIIKGWVNVVMDFSDTLYYVSKRPNVFIMLFQQFPCISFINL